MGEARYGHMFEVMNYEYIVERALSRVEKDIDKSEGSLIYTAISPIAWELAEAYILLDEVYNNCFADTASMEYLVRRAEERGIKPLDGTNAVLKGIFNCEIPINSRFSSKDLFYVVVEKVKDFEYKLECETTGTEGNLNFGELTEVEFIEGLESARLAELLIPGEDDEDIEAFRERYLNSVNAQTFGGNIADYKNALSKMQGVGQTKIYPVWDGGGTVKIVFTDSTDSKPSEELVKEVQENIDPETSGVGLGIAPVGHKVTVQGVDAVPINITSEITYDVGYSFATLGEGLKKAVKQYLLELSRAWDKTENLVIRTARIEMALLTVPGVIDVSGTTINGGSENIQLLPDEIPILGGLNE